MHKIEETQEDGKVTIRVTGALDSEAALLVRERIIAALTGATVAIDLTQAQPVQDSALAVLAELMRAAGNGQLSLRGLGTHQERILGYMGVNSSGCRVQLARHFMTRSTPLATPGHGVLLRPQT
jgi:anti-anti-sigma regulatory factor